ncbi:MAG: hypothetical protein HYY84_20950 [Deltaproteobacteria bacterium]|nr:hypothetical protein [Deltaproteobacteria bacterium]
MPVLVGFWAFAAMACGKDAAVAGSPFCADGGATFTAIQSAILTPTCATSSCHDAVSSATSGGLNLTASASHAQLVGANATTTFCTSAANSTRVAAGLTAQSCLHLRLTTTTAVERMPRNEGALAADKIDCIRTWIQNGAPNN